MNGIEIHGYAIVSRDGRIADAAGAMPDSLRNEADWAYFQSGLERADWVILGRKTHERSPNAKRRRRVVVSHAARGLEERADALWWRPDAIGFPELAARLAPNGGCFAVPGGQGVFDLFLGIGYSAFHLTRAETVFLPGGRGLFSGTQDPESAGAALKRSGLTPRPIQWLDVAAHVSLTEYVNAC